MPFGVDLHTKSSAWALPISAAALVEVLIGNSRRHLMTDTSTRIRHGTRACLPRLAFSALCRLHLRRLRLPGQTRRLGATSHRLQGYRPLWG
jgi:hypothetical protein